MKLKEGFILRQVAGENVVIPSGDELNLNGTGKLLWERLEAGAEDADLVQALLDEYDVDEKTAAANVAAFIQKLKDHGFLA